MSIIRYYNNGQDNSDGVESRYLSPRQVVAANAAWEIVRDNAGIAFQHNNRGERNRCMRGWEIVPNCVACVLLARTGVGRSNGRPVGGNTANRMARDGYVLSLGTDQPISDNQIIDAINATGRVGRQRVSVNSSRTQVNQTGTRVTTNRVTITDRQSRRTSVITLPDSGRYRTGGLRTVGLEVEVSNLTRRGFASAISNNGIASDAINHSAEYRANNADVTNDSTVPTGAEARGPAVTLDNFQTIYRPIMSAAREIGGRVGSECGLHCHTGVRGSALLTNAPELDGLAIVSILKWWKLHATTLDAFTTPDRRTTGTPQWCKPITDNNIEMVAAGGNTPHSSVINTGNVVSRGTLEFRLQRGTMNTKLAYGWAAIVAGITDHAASQTLPELQQGVSVSVLAEALLSPNPTRLEAALYVAERRAIA